MLLRRSGLAALVLTTSLGLTACGSGSKDKSAADVKEEISAQLQSDGGLAAEAADCFADVIVDEVGAKELNDVDFAAEEPTKALGEDLAGAAISARDKCDIDR